MVPSVLSLGTKHTVMYSQAKICQKFVLGQNINFERKRGYVSDFRYNNFSTLLIIDLAGIAKYNIIYLIMW